MKPELLAPAGNWDCVRAAAANGADAVYFGLDRFNARMRADNFKMADLPELTAFCRWHGMKAYVAFNTLVFTDELDNAADYLRALNASGVDGVIVQDIGLARLAREIAPELPLHASTQMTITSPEAAALVHEELGIRRVILARELSLKELEAFPSNIELEVFCHGALCVAYSGQCLTSESLGQRSANRGECAQACRLPYELMVDGAIRDLGDRRYLLSPQDLATTAEIPALLACGVHSFKIEGRLKSPEYVAAVCQVYRKALDGALVTPEDRYSLEMTFSRGFFTGWLHGIDHQKLVAARFGKKRGVFIGHIGRIGPMGQDFVELAALETAVKPGDGVAFDIGGDPDREQGGRVYEVRGKQLYFKHGLIDFAALKPGDRIWKTDDPALNATLKKSYTGRLEPRREPLTLTVSGRAGEPLRIEARGVAVDSAIPLQPARTAPLTEEKLREHLGRFGDAPFALGELRLELEGDVILPIGELNRLRRELAAQLDSKAVQEYRTPKKLCLTESVAHSAFGVRYSCTALESTLSVLCRTMPQLEAALAENIGTVYLDFEDPRQYTDAVRLACDTSVFLATPRVEKPGETGFFKLIESAQPDGVLLRNIGGIRHFRNTPLRKRGDFSLNVANPHTAAFFMERGLESVTISYDLNLAQTLALLHAAPPAWFELTIHQHMPMFHMEHCLFAAFLTNASTHRDCGRPCERHVLHLRDRVGAFHPLRVDAGCRNTLFNALAQTGAPFYDELFAAGLRHFRVELLEESAEEARRLIAAYRELLEGVQTGDNLWRNLRANAQLGVIKAV